MQRLAAPPLHLRLLILSIALIVATTLIPVAFRFPSTSYINYKYGAADFINNLLLYVPLGIALGGYSLLRTFLWGASLSTFAELMQLGYVDRIPSPFDVATNTAGALLGYVIGAYWLRANRSPISVTVPRPLAATALPAAIAGTIILLLHRPASDFSNWSPTFHLAIGNELTGDRPWNGTVSKLAIYPSAMDSSSIANLFRAGAARHTEPPAFALQPAANFNLLYGRPLLSEQEELKFYRALVTQSQLTILLWMSTGDLKQAGPARIVTYSQDSAKRNFTLGQIQNTLTFRLRTPASDENGTNPALYSGPVLAPDRPVFVAAVYDGCISRLYVDGQPVAQVDLSAKRPRLSARLVSLIPSSFPVQDIELNLSEIFLSGLFALGIFALTGVPRQLSMRAATGLLAGICIAAIIWFFGVSSAKLGVHILLECMAAGLVIGAALTSEPAL